MEKLLQQLEEYKKAISAESPTNAEEIESFRIKYLGTKGIVKSVMGFMKDVAVEKKERSRTTIK